VNVASNGINETPRNVDGTRVLDVSFNEEGSNGINETPHLPNEIFLLSNLREFLLANHSLSGSVPTEIGLLSDLVDVELGDNQITGPIPSELGLISTLQILSLEQNALTGPIPSELGQLSALRDLRLAGNALTGTIPSELLGQIPTLVGFFNLFVQYQVSTQPLQDVSSPQYQALEWMAYSDSIDLLSTLSDDELVERFTLVLLYYAAGGENWSDQAGFLSPLNNTCSWNSIVDGTTRVLGVSCNEEGSVVMLDLCKCLKSST
jgi:hypothetical protein